MMRLLTHVIMHTAKNFNELYEQIKARKIPFLIVFFVITVVTYTFLYSIDFYPEPKTIDADTEGTISVVANTPVITTEDSINNEINSENPITDTGNDVFEVEEARETPVSLPPEEALPVKIIFDSLGTETTVLNPTSRTIADLDAALLNGVVRHPDSADFANPGNIFILGHSSYLPTVFNQNFQAFNGIQKLEWGDTIRLQSKGREYTYRVDRVYKAKAADVVVPVDGDKAELTLATCNSFGSKDDRYIVESTLISDVSL